MVDPHCEILWYDNSGAGLGRHPTAYYGAAADNAANQEIITQQCLRSNMLGIWIKNYLTTDSKRKLRAFKYEYTFKTLYDGSAMLFFIVNFLWPDTRAGFFNIKSNLDNMKMSQLKYDIPKYNLQISECMNEISIAR